MEDGKTATVSDRLNEERPRPAMHELPPDDSIEQWGKRIARVLATVAAVGLLAYLILAYGLQ